MTPGRRLAAPARRHQLLDVGARLFATRSYEHVLMEDVAEQAGVSRALLYRHFTSKRDLFAAVYARAADQLVAVTDLHPGRPLLEQVTAGLEAHLDYFVENRTTVLAANLQLAGDPVIQRIISDELEILRTGLLDAAGLEGQPRQVVSSVLMGWLTFVHVLCVDWLQHEHFSRDALRDICVGALDGALGPLAVTGSRPGAAEAGARPSRRGR
jgi:AcrR family transcriptional regulator